MGYAISLLNPVTKECLNLNFRHSMYGTNIPCDEMLNPVGTTEASLGITYNYSNYYYEATDNDERFAHKNYDDKIVYGIRGIYGKTGAESIPMLKDMITRIKNKYSYTDKDGKEKWINGTRTYHVYRDKNGHEIGFDCYIRDLIDHAEEVTIEEKEYTVNEGDMSDYWEETAANAIRPLYQLLAMAQLRPDGIWDGD